jgi:hypothetical protein
MSDINTKRAIDKYRQEPWFHGSITRVVAEDRLESKMVGTFLFREAESRPGLSLSVRGPDRIKHFIISQNAEGKWFLVGKPSEFDDIFQLIKFYEETPTSTADGLRLKYPCPLEEEAAEDNSSTYIEVSKGKGLDQEKLDEVRRRSKDRRVSLISAGSGARGDSETPSPSPGGKHKYEFVTPM